MTAGVKDAGVVDDDSGDFVRAVTFTAPQRGKQHALELVIEEVPDVV